MPCVFNYVKLCFVKIISAGKFMEKIFSDISEYTKSILRIHYPKIKNKVKQLNKRSMQKEIKAASYYGALCVCQEILDEHKRAPYKTLDEVIGDLQIVVVESYQRSRGIMGLPIKEFTIEDVMQNGANIEVKK